MNHNSNTILLDKYILRNTSRAGCINEFYLFFKLIFQLKDTKEVRRRLLENEILGQFTYFTRLTIWKLFSARYLTIKDQWIMDEICESTNLPLGSSEFNSLLYLYFILRDKFTFEFVTDVLFEKFKNSSLNIDLKDIQTYYDQLALQHEEFNKLTNLSKKKLLSNTLTTLVDFQILSGKKIKTIAKPSIPFKTIYHLYRLLKYQGLTFDQIIDSNLWKIFFWNPQDVRRNLIELFNNNDYKDLKDNSNE